MVRAAWLAIAGVLLCAIFATMWQIAKPGVISLRAGRLRAERARALQAINEDLDTRYFKKRHYNPTGPQDDAWYGFTGEFPPGPSVGWVSDPRWNQIRFRPRGGHSYRYGLYTLGKDAWVFAYGDPDLDGRWSHVYRHYAEGRLVQEWQFRESE